MGPAKKWWQGRSGSERRSAACSPDKRRTLPQNSVRSRLVIDGHRERHTESELIRATIHPRQACLQRTATTMRHGEEQMLPFSLSLVCNTATRERDTESELIRATMTIRTGLALAERVHTHGADSSSSSANHIGARKRPTPIHLENIISVCVFFPRVHPRMQTAEDRPCASGQEGTPVPRAQGYFSLVTRDRRASRAAHRIRGRPCDYTLQIRTVLAQRPPTRRQEEAGDSSLSTVSLGCDTATEVCRSNGIRERHTESKRPYQFGLQLNGVQCAWNQRLFLLRQPHMEAREETPPIHPENIILCLHFSFRLSIRECRQQKTSRVRAGHEEATGSAACRSTGMATNSPNPTFSVRP